MAPAAEPRAVRRRWAERTLNSKLATLVLLVISSTLCSCGADTVEPCDLWVASAVVSGQVTDSGSGGPIANTEVEVMVANSSECTGGEQWGESRRVMTDNFGQFSVTLELGNQRGVPSVPTWLRHRPPWSLV